MYRYYNRLALVCLQAEEIERLAKEEGKTMAVTVRTLPVRGGPLGLRDSRVRSALD